MTAGPRRRAGQGGFSLLEVLVAFAVLAISLGVLMQIFSRAGLTAAASDQYSRAATLAESRLEAVGSAIPLQEGAASGDPEDGFAWEVSIAQVDLGLGDQGAFGPSLLAEPGAGLPAIPYRVTVLVLWEDGGQARRLALSTLRLGPQAEPQ
jgi:general secretion pathway protein I